LNTDSRKKCFWIQNEYINLCTPRSINVVKFVEVELWLTHATIRLNCSEYKFVGVKAKCWIVPRKKIEREPSLVNVKCKSWFWTIRRESIEQDYHESKIVF